MTYTRRDVLGLGSDWNDTLLWYARAVKLMRSRPITDVTSWTFVAAMHGFDPPTWAYFGYLDQTKPLPSAALQNTYWKQCQHQTWYFLPWHRGYVWSFESIVRAAVASLAGPADWTLPYWDYNNATYPQANQLPAAFASEDWPDGADDNPLFEKYRYGLNRAPIVVPPNQIRTVAQGDKLFTGGANGSHPGFGGPQTLFHHGGEDNQPSGGVESEPHNNVHSVVGGQLPGSDPNDPKSYGLMAVPDQAALDPIFWLHHANIDRLWKVWLNNGAAHANPTSNAWLNGPVSRVFAVPDASGNQVSFTPAQMLDTTAPNLDYVYEDENNPKPPPGRTALLTALGVPAAQMVSAMASPSTPKPIQLMGATDRRINLAAGERTANVRLDAPTKARMVQSFAATTADAATRPDRVYLELDNIRGAQEAALVEVYVGRPGDSTTSPANLAGTISGFGLTKATREGPRNGLSQVFDISEIVDDLHLGGALAGLRNLQVTFVPVTPLHKEGGLSVGAVKIVRQPQ